MIDFHTHPVLIKEIVGSNETLLKAVRNVFKMGSSLQPLKTFLLQMDVAGIQRAVLLPCPLPVFGNSLLIYLGSTFSGDNSSTFS